MLPPCRSRAGYSNRVGLDPVVVYSGRTGVMLSMPAVRNKGRFTPDGVKRMWMACVRQNGVKEAEIRLDIM